MRTKVAVIMNMAVISIVTPIMAGITGREVIEKSYEVTKLAGTEAVMSMTIADGRGRERVRKTAQVSKLYDDGETEKKLIRFLEPADVKGTGFLTCDYENKDDDKWLFMPALRKTRRIVSSEKGKSFMGSEFTYGDITRPNLDEFSYELLAEETVGDVACYKVQLLPADEEIADANGFSRKISWIGKEDFVLRKSLYFDLDGELHRELEVGKIVKLDKKLQRYKITEMVMTNKQNGRVSTFVTEQIKFSPDLPDEYFSLRYLERQ